MPCFVCHNLGTFKKYKDIGLTSYRYLRFSTCQNLGVFHKNHFLDSKNPWPTFACQNLGIFEECKDGPHCDKIPGLTPVDILGYFLRTRFLTPKTHCLCGLSKSWGFKEYKDIGPTWYPNQRYPSIFVFCFCFVLFCFVFGYFITMFLKPKTHGLFLCLSKSWGFR